MTIITKDNVGDYKVTGVFDIVGETSADATDKANKDGVKCTFRFIFDNEPLSEVIDAALSQKKINKQTKMRKELALYHNGQVITIPFKGEGKRRQADAVVTIVMLAEAAGMSVEEYVQAEMAKRKAAQA